MEKGKRQKMENEKKSLCCSLYGITVTDDMMLMMTTVNYARAMVVQCVCFLGALYINSNPMNIVTSCYKILQKII